MRQLDRNLQHLARHLAFRVLGPTGKRGDWQQGGGERHAIEAGSALSHAHGETLSAERWNIGRRSIALYQSIILAVRNITAMPAALTASCSATSEPYSVMMKCPSA